MKPSCLLRPSPPSISSLFHKLSTSTCRCFPQMSASSVGKVVSSGTNNLGFESCQHIQTALVAPHTPKTPLFMRPPIYSTPSSDLQTFTTWAKHLITSVGPTFTDLDPTLLHRELKWLLDDAVEDPSLKVVNLRERLETMYTLWEDRVVKRRPFQYVVGCEHWRDLVLSVEEGVLIPRPETGEIVDFVEGLGLGGKGGVWADLGTGSGALAIGIARVLGGQSKVRVVGTDVSHVAVAVARYNVERYGLQDTIDIRHGSWFDPVMEFEGQLSGLVSNPPYIPSEDISGLQAEVGKHEPWLALDGGVEGLDYLSYLCSKTSTMLKPGGFFAFETNGEKQCKILADYLENMTGGSICDVNIVSDFAGVPRFVTGHRKN